MSTQTQKIFKMSAQAFHGWVTQQLKTAGTEDEVTSAKRLTHLAGVIKAASFEDSATGAESPWKVTMESAYAPEGDGTVMDITAVDDQSDKTTAATSLPQAPDASFSENTAPPAKEPGTGVPAPATSLGAEPPAKPAAGASFSSNGLQKVLSGVLKSLEEIGITPPVAAPPADVSKSDNVVWPSNMNREINFDKAGDMSDVAKASDLTWGADPESLRAELVVPFLSLL